MVRFITAEDLKVGDIVEVRDGKQLVSLTIEKLTRTPTRGFVNVTFANEAGTKRYHPRGYAALLVSQ